MTAAIVKTSCSLCMCRCGLNVHVSEGKIIKVEGMLEHPVSRGYICPKAENFPDLVYHPDRLRYPMKKVNGSWTRISWDEALDIIATKLKEIKSNYGPESLLVYVGGVVFYDGVPAWMLLRRFLDVYGTPNYFSVDSMCFRPRGIAYFLTLGGQWRPEVENSKALMLIGANVEHSYPPLIEVIRVARQRGCKLIVVDPKRIPLAKDADIHIQLRPGTDCALLLAMMNVIITEGLYDREFVEKYTVGFDKLVDHVKTYTPERMAKITWVPAEKIREAARLFGTVKPASIFQGFNTLDQTTAGFQSDRAIPILCAITGNVDIPGGLVSYVALPKVNQTRMTHMLKSDPLWKDKYPLMYDVWGRPVGEGQCLDLPDVLQTGKPYPIKAMIIDGSNPALTWPNTNRAVEALKKVEFLVVMDLFMTPTTELAHLVLPAATSLERTDFVICNRITPHIMLKKKIIQLDECWHDGKFWLKLAQKMGYEEYFPWKDPDEFIDYWMEPSGLSVKMLTEETPEGMRLEMKYGVSREKGFSTPSGKIEIYSDTLEKFGYDPLPIYLEPIESPVSTPNVADYPLILTTGARQIHYTHTQLRNVPAIRKLFPEPLAEIHPETAMKYGIMDGDTTKISTKRGSIEMKAKVTEDMLPQVVSIPHGWREANCNILTFARPADPVTGVPNYKALLCRIEKTEDVKGGRSKSRAAKVSGVRKKVRRPSISARGNIGAARKEETVGR
jgi:anaerobic selenocysteine-containing dehydrogenase